MAESVQKFANDAILPKVREMDEAEMMDPKVVEQLFEQGLMGIEIPEEYGGSGMNFTSAIIAIEELARIDPSVSVMCDVHNTLCNTAIIKYGSQSLKKRFLPKLATDTVGRSLSLNNTNMVRTDPSSFLLSFRTCVWIRRFRTCNQSYADREWL